VRCFLREVTGQRRRYECFSQYLSGFWLPALVDFEYLPEGIRVGNVWYPIVKMEWVDGLTLHTFIDRHKDNRGMLLNLVRQWRGILAGLRGVRLAHGDLQHGNILVTADGFLRLVDYDGMFVPPLRGQQCPELGHSNYQHPQRQADNYDKSLDDFSALVIYLSLRGPAADTSLWQQFHNEENLLFREDDYQNPAQSGVLQKLQRSPDEQVKYLAEQLANSCRNSMAQANDLETILQKAPSARMPITVLMPDIQMPKSPPVSRQTIPTQTQAQSTAQPWWQTVTTDSGTTQPLTQQVRDRWAFMRRNWLIFVLAVIIFVLVVNNIRLSFHSNKPDVQPMVLIPAGEFQMGDNFNEGSDDERPVHTVYLNAFYIDQYEVTNAQYANFLNAYGKNVDAAGHELLDINSSYCLIEKVGNTYKPRSGYENHPVVEVSWYGAAAYAQFYGKRLPTEAEWEKAARGGLKGKRYPWGDDISHDDANYSLTGGKDQWNGTSPVGSFAPNGYGLYDMAGNVWELCADEYNSDYYSRSPRDNPKGSGTAITFKNNDFTYVWVIHRRVLRGGSWRDFPFFLRCANRDDSIPTNTRYFGGGFRCVQDP